MGSNRKLIFGAVLVVAGLVFWGLMTALNNIGSKSGASNRVAANVANNVQTVSLPPAGRLIAYPKANIPQGTLVTKDMLEMRPLEGSAPTTPYVTDMLTQAVGYVTAVPLAKGAAIRPGDDFVGHISEVGIAGMLQPGKRAMVIPFANKPTLHDLVAIGDRVDVNAAFDGQEARTIVPDVRVLAVDVFGSDFPQTNIARRGAYRADPKGGPLPPAGEAPPAPGTTPTPTPTPGQGAARPDPAVTLEVTPEQANRILLAQASAGVLDFVVLPTRNATMVGGGGATDPLGLPVGEQFGGIGGLTTISAVTKPQLAPFAESKKASGGASTRGASRGEGSSNAADRTAREPRRFNPSSLREVALPALPPVTINPNPGSSGSGLNGSGLGSASNNPDGGAASSSSSTYNIPIYADGRTVRVETVPRPQE